MLPYFKIGSILIYSYPLIVGISWGLGYFFSKDILEKRKINFTNFNSLYLGVFLFSWIGAKVLFLLTSDNSDKILASSNFWLGGGFVFYGGLIGGLIALGGFSIYSKNKAGDYESFLPVLAFCHGIGRIGCFLAGCCYGGSCHLTAFVGMRYPVQLIESLSLFGLSYLTYKKVLKDKSAFKFYIRSYGVLRFLLEYLRGDEIRGVYGHFSTSQLISISLILITFIPTKNVFCRES